MKNLSLKPLAIGSLPYDNPIDAMEYIFSLYKVPFWAQLSKVSKFEDMTSQYLQNIPGIEFLEDEQKFILNSQSEIFFEKLEEFYMDYEEIINNNNYELLEKYAVTPPYSSTFKIFTDKLSNSDYEFVKGHVTGSFTLGASICDENGKAVFFDASLRDVITKACAVKALWQVVQIKKVNKNITPVIFVDEPALSQYGTSAFVTVQKSEIIESLSEIVKAVQSAGGLCGIHCCGKGDWGLMIDCGMDILNLDGYSYAQTLSIYAKQVREFLQNGGYIAWGIVPTLDKDALEQINLDIALKKFDEAIDYLIKKGIDKNLIIKQSLVTPSCGCGSLSLELAQKAMELNVQLADALHEKYSELNV